MPIIMFAYYPAFVSTPKSETRASIWPVHPQDPRVNFNSRYTFDIDLALCPSNSAIRFDEIQVDDYANSPAHGFTTLGPAFPHAYGAAGVYISISHLESKGADRVRILEGLPHERRALVDISYDRKTVRRYHGFSAEQIDASKGIYAVYHANTSLEKRPPRILRIPPDKILQGSSVAPRLVESASAIAVYLEQGFLEASLLDIPKRPSGSGEAAKAMLAALSSEFADFGEPPRDRAVEVTSSRFVSGGPLNLFGEGTSDEVERIQGKLGVNQVTLARTKKLVDVLPDTGSFSSLDLIGHSRRDGVLKLGELPLTPARVRRMFAGSKEKLNALGIARIRLLGCRTACSQEGRESAAAIRAETGIGVVEGTRADIFAVHFDSRVGFAAKRLIAADEVMSLSGPGDAPPVDDPTTVLPCRSPTSPTVPPTPPASPATHPFSLDSLNRSESGVVRPKAYWYWTPKDANEGIDGVRRCLDDPEGAFDETHAVADWEVVLEIQTEVHSFEVVREGTNAWLRINFTDESYRYAVNPGKVDDMLRIVGILARP